MGWDNFIIPEGVSWCQYWGIQQVICGQGGICEINIKREPGLKRGGVIEKAEIRWNNNVILIETNQKCENQIHHWWYLPNIFAVLNTRLMIWVLCDWRLLGERIMGEPSQTKFSEGTTNWQLNNEQSHWLLNLARGPLSILPSRYFITHIQGATWAVLSRRREDIYSLDPVPSTQARWNFLSR